ncbi:MAG: hypothetical protein JOZ62_24305 [Acidobacteriaceae bacterium]|nr:hypothetical protein [Acidobacteriaceae bacterium]
MLGQHGEALLKKCVVMALNGDTTALRLCIERLLPPRKQSPVQFKLPPIATAAELAHAQAKILKVLSHGQLTPAEAESVSNLLENRRQMMEAQAFEARLEALEQRQRERSAPGDS